MRNHLVHLSHPTPCVVPAAPLDLHSHPHPLVWMWQKQENTITHHQGLFTGYILNIRVDLQKFKKKHGTESVIHPGQVSLSWSIQGDMLTSTAGWASCVGNERWLRRKGTAEGSVLRAAGPAVRCVITKAKGTGSVFLEPVWVEGTIFSLYPVKPSIWIFCSILSHLRRALCRKQHFTSRLTCPV